MGRFVLRDFGTTHLTLHLSLMVAQHMFEDPQMTLVLVRHSSQQRVVIGSVLVESVIAH